PAATQAKSGSREVARPPARKKSVFHPWLDLVRRCGELAAMTTPSQMRFKHERGKLPSASEFRAWVPPHPCLSPGERENRPPPRGECRAPRLVAARDAVFPAHEPQNTTIDYQRLAEVEVQGCKARNCSGNSLPEGDCGSA